MTNDIDYKVCSICGSLVDKKNIFNFKDIELCKTCVEKKLEEKENISPLATFFCSLIPGVGQIFLGKRQKGLFLLSIFILNILLSFLVISIFLNFTIYLYSLFDANISRKYIENKTYIDGFIDKLAYKVFKSKNENYLQEKIIDKRLQ